MENTPGKDFIQAYIELQALNSAAGGQGRIVRWKPWDGSELTIQARAFPRFYLTVHAPDKGANVSKKDAMLLRDFLTALIDTWDERLDCFKAASEITVTVDAP